MCLYPFDKPIKSLYFPLLVVSVLFARFHFKVIRKSLYQFLLDVVFACSYMKGSARLRYHFLYEHSLDRFAGWFSYCIFYISEFLFCLLYHSHPFVDEGIIKRIAHASC